MATNYSTIQEVSHPAPALESANALLLIKAEESLIQLSWKSSPTPAELTECADLISELIKEHQICHFLHDVRNVNYVDVNLQRCLTKVFCPQVMAAGITRFVHLAKYALPELLVMDQITDYLKSRVLTDNTVKLEICTTLNGAREWLFNDSEQNIFSPAKSEVKELVAEQAGYIWAAAAQISTSLKQHKEKAALIFRILTKRKSLFSDL